MKQKFSFRKFFTDIHLWLGLASGLVLFVVCLTGTILTFEHEIVEWADAQKYHADAAAGTKPLPVERLIADLEHSLKGKVQSVEIPKERDAVYRFAVKAATGGKKGEKGGKGGGGFQGGPGAEAGATEGRAAGKGAAGKGAAAGRDGGAGGGRGKTYLVNPYTGEVTGTTESATAKFFSVVMGLHRWLLVPDGAGKIIVGIATIMFVFLCLTGLFIWFPVKARDWKRGLKIKFSANWKRVNHDLHNTLGFYALIFLLVMSLTGLCWSFAWYRSGLSAILKDEVFKQRKEKAMLSDLAGATGVRSAGGAGMAAGGDVGVGSSSGVPVPGDVGMAKSVSVNGTSGRISIDGVLLEAEKLLPYEGNYRVRLPQDSTGSFVINKSRSGFMVRTAADKVQFDQYTGAVLKLEKFSDKRVNEQVAASVRSLHLGDVYGTSSKIIYFLACLFATSLPVTGTIIWLNKLKKKRKNKKRYPQPLGI